MIIGSDGNKLPLGSAAAAALLTSGDPIWCPNTSAPLAGVNGCTSSYTNLYLLINDINTAVIAQPSKDGTIWIEGGSDASSSDITLDGSALGTWAQYSLTLQGGWDGTSLGGVSGTSDFLKPISITNWKNTITIKDLTVGSTSGSGLTVGTSGNVSLENVSSHDNGLDGADIASGADVYLSDSSFNNNGGGYAVLESTDPDTGADVHTAVAGDGLSVTAAGDINLTNVDANSNSGRGAVLTSTSGGIDVTGGNFNDNGTVGSFTIKTGTDLPESEGATLTIAYLELFGGDGLDATTTADSSDSSVTLDQVIASGNLGTGASLDSAWGASVTDSSFDQNGDTAHTLIDNETNSYPVSVFGNTLYVTITSETQNYDTGPGLNVSTAEDASFSNVSAADNGGAGAVISSGAGGVEVSGSSFDSNGTSPSSYYSSSSCACIFASSSSYTRSKNGADGLDVSAPNGPVSVQETEADGNGAAGSSIRGANFDDGDAVSIYSSDFSGNGFVGVYNESGGSGYSTPSTSQSNDNGLDAYADGELQLTGVTASGNAAGGAYVGQGGDLIITSSTFDSNGYSAGYDDNGLTSVADGLDANVDDNVTLTQVEASGNAGYGGSLESNYGDFSISGGTFNGNGQVPITHSYATLYGDGLDLTAYSGQITVQDLTASNNMGYGASFYAEGNVTVSGSTFDRNGAGLNEYTDPVSYYGSGLYAGSDGDITLTDVTADSNFAQGAELGDYGGIINVNGGQYACNTAYGLGIYDDFATLNIYGATLSGNGSGPYGNLDHAGSPFSGALGTITYSKNGPCRPGGNGGSVSGPPYNVIPIPDTGGPSNALDCADYTGTELVLPNGDMALLPCPIGANASLVHILQAKLPGSLDGKSTFVSALDLDVTPSLSGTATVSFKVPSGKPSSNLAILHWDGTKWVNLGGSATPPGYFSVDTSLSGDFVLVTQ